MRVGIAGYGVVGKMRHDSIIDNTNFKVISISEKRLQGREKISKDIQVFEDYKSLIADSDIDAIFISLPNQYAADATILSLKKGLHVFCEKPPARTLAELERVKEVHEQHPELKLMYGFNHRFHLSVEKAKSIIQSSVLGKVINLKGTYGKSQIISFNQTDWRTKREEAGGGILLDQGIHMLDLIRYLSGENFIKIFGYKIINIHPSLLPKYKGLDTHKRVLKNNEKFSGCTVHYVTTKLDSGKIILQKKIKIDKTDKENTLRKKILKEEHKLYPRAIMKIFN